MTDVEGIRMREEERQRAKFDKLQMNINKADSKIGETQSELAKCQERLAKLKQQQQEIQKMSMTSGDRFMNFEKKAPTG